LRSRDRRRPETLAMEQPAGRQIDSILASDCGALSSSGDSLPCIQIKGLALGGLHSEILCARPLADLHSAVIRGYPDPKPPPPIEKDERRGLRRYNFLLFGKSKMATPEFVEPRVMKRIIRGSPSRAPCVPWRARQATSSNRRQCEGARDQSQFEPTSRQSTRLQPA